MKKNEKEIMSTVAEVQVSYYPKRKISEMEVVKNSLDFYRLFRESWNMGTIGMQEEFKVMLLNPAARVKGIYLASKGGLTETIADPRIVMITALSGLASSIVLAHNHPSGNLKPSRADIELTHKIKNAGSYLNIRLLDHIILNSEGYYSMADEGLL